MKGFSKFKAIVNNKLFVYALNILMMGVMLFFVLTPSIFSEIKFILEILNVKDAERVLTNSMLFYKSVHDLSQVLTIISVVVKVLASFIAFSILLVLFVKVVEAVVLKNKKEHYNTEAIITANYAGVYIIQSKFLC